MVGPVCKFIFKNRVGRIKNHDIIIAPKQKTFIYILHEKTIPGSVADQDNTGLRYIGSTINPKKRFANHRSHFKLFLKDPSLIRCSSVYIFEKYGLENVEMTILEEVVQKDLVKSREIYHINQQPKNVCVNSRNKLFGTC
jgi:hypothetical protein